jgi:hypothetical protein
MRKFLILQHSLTENIFHKFEETKTKRTISNKSSEQFARELGD